MRRKLYKGIPRENIPWYPTIDYDKCVHCLKCVDYCKLRAYKVEEKNGKKISIVSNPYNCVVLCKGCQDICPSGAISHQSKKDTLSIIRKLVIEGKLKD